MIAVSMVVDKRTANDRCTDTDGDPFPPMPLFGPCPSRGGYQIKTQNRCDSYDQPVCRFHIQPPVCGFTVIDTGDPKKFISFAMPFCDNITIGSIVCEMANKYFDDLMFADIYLTGSEIIHLETVNRLGSHLERQA